MTNLVLVRCDPFVGQVAEHLPQHIGISRLFKIGDHDLLGLVSVRKVIESYESDVIQGRPWQIEDEADVDSRKPRLL